MVEKYGRWPQFRGKNLSLLVFGISFFFFGFLMWCAPFSSDDLEFATYRTLPLREVVRYVLEYGNGRFVGNLFGVLMVRWPVFGWIGKAFVMASSVVLLPALVDRRSPADYLLTFLLIVGVDPVLFGEVYVWTSGFNNYIAPIWCTMVILWIIRSTRDNSGVFSRGGICLLVFLLGTASQLYIEHSSGVNLLLALSAVLYCALRRNFRQLIPCGCWLLGTAVGMALMFLIPVWFYVEANHSVNYRYTYLGNLFELVYSCLRNAIKLGEHFWGLNTLPVCLGATVTLLLPRRKKWKHDAMLLGICQTVTAGLLLSQLAAINGYWGEIALLQHTVTLGCILVVLAIWMLAAFSLEDEKLRLGVVLSLVFAVISLAPLLVVSPIPMRVIYQSYFFVAAAALMCIGEYLDRMPPQKGKTAQKMLAVCCALVICLISLVHISVHSMATAREAYIHSQLEEGSTSIDVFILPYAYTSWDQLWSLPIYGEYMTGHRVEPNLVDFHFWMQNHR